MTSLSNLFGKSMNPNTQFHLVSEAIEVLLLYLVVMVFNQITLPEERLIHKEEENKSEYMKTVKEYLSSFYNLYYHCIAYH